MTVEKHEPNEGTSEQGPAMEERRVRHIDFANALQENPRAKKLLFLLATENFPSPDVADRIDTDAVLHELRMRLPTAEDVWHEATRRVQHITTERLPGQTDTDYATRNTEKQEEYLGELRRSFDAIYTSFVSEPTPPTAKMHSALLKVWRLLLMMLHASNSTHRPHNTSRICLRQPHTNPYSPQKHNRRLPLPTRITRGVERPESALIFPLCMKHWDALRFSPVKH